MSTGRMCCLGRRSSVPISFRMSCSPAREQLDSARAGRHKGPAHCVSQALRIGGPGSDANQKNRALTLRSSPQPSRKNVFLKVADDQDNLSDRAGERAHRCCVVAFNGTGTMDRVLRYSRHSYRSVRSRDCRSKNLC